MISYNRCCGSGSGVEHRLAKARVASSNLVFRSIFIFWKIQQSRAKQSKAEQSKAKQSKAEQSKAKQSKAEQSRAKQSKAKQSKAKQRIRIETVPSMCKEDSLY